MFGRHTHAADLQTAATIKDQAAHREAANDHKVTALRLRTEAARHRAEAAQQQQEA